MGPNGSENLKTLLPQLSFFFGSIFSKCVTVLTKVIYWHFEISILIFVKRRLKFNIVANG